MMRTILFLFISFLPILLLGQAKKTILIQNCYYPKAGKEDEVYQWRIHASDVRVKLGLPKGRVLKKISTNEGPYVLWICEYPSLEAREKDVILIDKSEEFKNVQEHM